ncbi:MAG: MaoC family dehydratase [Desulfuromonadales bacterium]|jgi:acyl dehydratase|nr:MaoC family dehydratase [Gammaproteobacteria bacterium]MDH3923028.1 MaoC family dehydratase [Xanthomonadales bacterium]MDH3959716.1 MaoC family dehydratase [Desulfuromonadales bacterium]
MTTKIHDGIKVGDELPAITKPPVTRTTLALFAGASNDHNPIHIDTDFARKCGMDDVFAQGMLGMAYLGQVVTHWASQAALRSFGVRFVAITHLGDEIRCSGKVGDIFEQDGERRARLEIQAANQHGDVKLSGFAVVAVP